MKHYSIAIDGPAASGKSSIAKELAKQLNFDYVNSGSFYRAIAWFFYSNKINYDNPNNFSEQWLENNIKLKWDGDNILLNDVDVSDRIKENFISNIASNIAVYPSIRNFVNKNILELSNLRSIVVDGRDIGTCVLPNATAKIFLDADVKTRAYRRVKQYQEKNGRHLSVDQVINELIERDNRDYSRQIAPLAKADDAVIIDNSQIGFDDTLELIKKTYYGKVINEFWKK